MQLIISREDWRVAGVFNIARGPQTVAYLVVVELRDGDAVGRGECEPQDHYGESVDSVVAQIESVRSRLEAGVSRDELQRLLPAGAARNAVDCALWDLEAKRGGTTAWRLAGLPAPKPIATDFTISLDTPGAMHRQALRFAEWPILKIKLGGEGRDVERVEAVRAAAPLARFTVDANESWSVGQLERDAARLAALGVELIEQPLPAGRDGALAGLNLPIPVCADESCHTTDSLDVVTGLYQFVNIKLDKTGGLTEALRLARAARERGFGIMIGCMTGTSLAIAPALLVAGLADYVDLDGPVMLERDRVPGIHYDRGVADPAPSTLWG